MCEFCLKHGEGRKWYLRAENYADDMLSDAKRRRFFETLLTDTAGIRKGLRRLDRLAKLPAFVRRMVGGAITRHMKKVHFGQVVPIEDVARIFETVNCIVRVACLCRHVTHGTEQRYCYGLSMAPDGGRLEEIIDGLDDSFINGPDTAGLERVTVQEALDALRDHEQEGRCHTVWTFHTPFIGGICNCDNAGCLAMHCTLTRNIPMMFRAEYVAAVDPDRCTGCGECRRVCPFDAVTVDAADEKAAIDPHRCYGCGICRAACPAAAIDLRDRRDVPAVAGLWQ